MSDETFLLWKFIELGSHIVISALGCYAGYRIAVKFKELELAKERENKKE